GYAAPVVPRRFATHLAVLTNRASGTPCTADAQRSLALCGTALSASRKDNCRSCDRPRDDVRRTRRNSCDTAEPWAFAYLLSAPSHVLSSLMGRSHSSALAHRKKSKDLAMRARNAKRQKIED